MSKKIAIAQFDYKAEAPDELSLKVGDVITNIKQVEDGWCQGNLNGKVGMFPDNFVKMEEEKAPPPKSTSVKAKKDSKRYMKVTFAYDPANSDELKLNVDDIVEVIQDEEEGWAQGSVNGQKGVFPTNFCVEYTPNTVVPDAVSCTVEEPKEPEPKAQTNQVPPKKVHGVGFGNIFGGGPIKLKSAGGDAIVHEKANKKSSDEKPSMQNKKEEKPINKVAEEKQAPTGGSGKDKMNRTAQPRSSRRQSKPVEKCKVQFEYKATTSDELTLVVGDIITVTNKNCEDDGWWEGELVDKNGRKQRGVFPDNFVVLLPSESEPDTPASKEREENATSDTKAKENHVETDSPEEKPGSPPPSDNNSQKKPCPEAPPANAKPQVEDTTVSDLDAVVDSAPPDAKQLVHYRRVSGPKNRRRPDSSHRRERAKEAAEEAAAVAAEVDSEPESPKPEPEPAPQVAPKKELPKGIPVMPMMPGMGLDKPGEKPDWLKNLKRTSVKKDIPPKPEEPANKTPEWLSNMRKKEKKETPNVSNKPAPLVTTPKPSFHANRASLISPSGHAPPIRPTSPKAAEEKIDKPTSFKRTPKKENDATVAVQSPEAEEAKPEVKKFPARPPIPSQQPVGEIPKKPIAPAKPKPPPAKVKPVLPASKPFHASPTAMEELKEELKNLREQISNFQKDSMKEISRLTNELEEEKKQRISLQNEVANLQKKVG